MGCIAVEKQKSAKLLTNLDIKLIWNKCLKIQSITMHHKIKYQHPSFPQIDKDVDRTFPQHPLFEMTETKQSFARILKAFALQFPKVGYTQGLNFVVGFLLIAGLNEQNALKAMIGLCSNSDLMLLGLYQDDFPLCRLYCSLFWQVAFKISPKTSKLIKNAGLVDELWLFQWFITLFIYSLPLSYIQDIFNFIIVKRYFACIRIALAILQCLERYLQNTASLNEKGLIECFQLMKNEQFCLKYLPLSSILKRAQKIKKGMIMKCLQQNQCNNWYRYYFLTTDPHRQKKYSQFINDLNEERLRFEKQNSSDKNRYSRENSSVQILDLVEDNKYQRYSHLLLRSNNSRATLFSVLEEKNYNSLAVTQPQDF